MFPFEKEEVTPAAMAGNSPLAGHGPRRQPSVGRLSIAGLATFGFRGVSGLSRRLTAACPLSLRRHPLALERFLEMRDNLKNAVGRIDRCFNHFQLVLKDLRWIQGRHACD